MGLFGLDEKSTLEDVLGKQADTAVAGIKDDYAQKRRRLAAQQAHSGRLLSGVSDYNFGDLGAGEAGDIGNVYSNLSGALAGIPAEDMLNQNAYQQNLKLAKLIGEMNKPSALEEALGGLRAAGSIASTAAAFA